MKFAFSICIVALAFIVGDASAQRRVIVRSSGCASDHCPPPVAVVPVAPSVPAYTPPTIPAYGPNWKSDAIKYAEGQADHAAYLATLKALGINGQTYSYGFGQSLLFGANATTNYGYSYNTIAQLYGDTSLAQLYQQSAQLTSGAQKLAGDAHQGHQLLVGQEGANRARVAEILAKGQTAEQILKALNGPNVLQTQTSITGPAPVPVLPPARVGVDKASGGDLEAFQALVGARCASCHSGSVRKGGIDLAGYLSFSTDQKQRVISAITSIDPKAMMPRNADGSPGKRLTPDEMKLFFTN